MSQTAVVTGASYGLGRATAERLIADGYSVMLTDVSERVFDTEHELAATGSPVAATLLDVRDPESVGAGFDEAVRRFGPIAVVVSNAAAARSAASVADISIPVWDETWSINVRGSLLCIQAAARRMIDSGIAGRIVLMASIAGLKPLRRKAAYCSTKAAIIMLTRVSALDLAEFGIRVNCVCPGPTWTENLRRLDDGLLGHVEQAEFRARNAAIPFGIGQAADVADTVAYLVSPEAKHMTGQALVVDGGATLM
jgi:NAD(P)-dependent dehydrogenase (short-subunit alcohol dehydrogenase family)